MGHFIVVCKDCKKIITQCRCPAKDKRTIYETCDKCKEKNEK